jgi:hypothetical protein
MGGFLTPRTIEEVHEGKVRFQAIVDDHGGKRLADCPHWHLKEREAQRCAERIAGVATA